MTLDHESRALGIGASEIAIIAGVAKYGSATDIWLDKKHGIRKQAEGYHIERGTHLESSLLGWYQQRIRNMLADQGSIMIVDLENFVHPKHPLCRATPDGLLVTSESRDSEWAADQALLSPPRNWADRVVEIKAPSSHTWRDWGAPGTDQIPQYYLPQVTWEMAATGVRKCDVAALVNDDLQIYHVGFLGELFDKLLSIARDWWDAYIIGDREPPPDASEGYRHYLAERYPRVVRPELEQAGEAEEQLILDYARARADLKDAEAAKSVAKAALCRAIGDRAGLESPVGRARWGSHKGSWRWDKAAMEADGIDITKYYTQGPDRRQLGVWETRNG
jgi:putative phage-type endonuclease